MAFNTGGNNYDDDMPMAEINIIPLVDVMLVLLIITMITSPFMEEGVNINLPTAQGKTLQKTSQEEPLTVFISKDRNVRIGKTPVPKANLAKKLISIMKNRQTKELFVRADKSVPYGIVAEVMALIQSSGIEKVGLVTQEQQ